MDHVNQQSNNNVHYEEVRLAMENQELLKDILGKVQEISETLNGKGEAVGLKGKVDRHERKFQSYDKFLWILVTAIVGILVKVFAV